MIGPVALDARVLRCIRRLRVVVLATGAIALFACPARTVLHTQAADLMQPRQDPACSQAARERAHVPTLLLEGKLDRAVRVIQQADRDCPASASLTWAQLVETLMDLGRWEEAERLAAEIARSAAATPDALRAARNVRSRAPDISARAPDPEGLYSRGVAAKARGEEAAAQRFFDLAAVDLVRAGKASTGGAVELSLDTPNGLSSRCLCDYHNPPACTCGGSRFGDPSADPLDATTGGRAWAIAYSHDGRTFAASHGERIFVFATRTLQERLRLEGHTAFVRALAFAPDDRTLISGADDRTARRWDLATGKELTRLTNDGAGVTALTYSPDGTWLATGSGHGTFFAWDPATSQDVQEVSKDRCSVDALAFSADGKTLAAALCVQQIVLLEPPWFTRRADMEKRIGAWGRGAAWSPSERTLAFGSEREGLWIAEPDTGRKRQLAKKSSGLVAWSPDGTRLSTSSPSMIFDLQTSQIRAFSGHRHGAHAMVFGPDGKTLATSGEYDGTVRFWDAATGAELQAIRPHSPAVRALALSPSGASLASTWGDGMLRVVDLASGKVRWSAPLGTGRTDSLAFSPDGKVLAALGAPTSDRAPPDDVRPRRILIWDASTGAGVTHLDSSDLTGGLAWSRDGKVLAAGGGQQILRWSMPGWKPLPPLSTWCSDDGLKACVVDRVAWSPDGRTLLAGAFRMGVVRWDVANDERQRVRRTAAMVNASPGDGGLLDFLDLTAAQPAAARVTRWRITSAAFQPGSQAVAVGRKDRTVALLDGKGEQALGVLRGHADEVNTVVWTPDGRALLSGSEDGDIRFWSPDGRPLAVLRVVEGTSSSYVFTEGPDARIEVFGPEGARFPLCRAGRESLPFAACAERFLVPGLLVAALAGDRSVLRP